MKTRGPFDELLKQATRVLTGGSRADAECPEESELASYLDRRLLPEQEQELEAHMVGCARCRGTLVAVATLSRTSAQAGDPGGSRPPSDSELEGDEAAGIPDFEEELSRLEEELGIRKECPDRKAMPRIMVVDDDLIYLDSLTDVLSEDYSVVACSSGREALEKVSNRINRDW